MEDRCILLGNLEEGFQGIGSYERSRRFYSPLGISPCIAAHSGGGQDVKVGVEIDMADKVGVRRLTPRECYRLMGFDDEDFDKASATQCETALYKQAGNSIVVNVLERIFTQLKPYFRKEGD